MSKSSAEQLGMKKGLLSNYNCKLSLNNNLIPEVLCGVLVRLYVWPLT